MDRRGLREFRHFFHPPQEVLILAEWHCWISAGHAGDVLCQCFVHENK
jgi:hypothetical protein